MANPMAAVEFTPPSQSFLCLHHHKNHRYTQTPFVAKVVVNAGTPTAVPVEEQSTALKPKWESQPNNVNGLWREGQSRDLRGIPVDSNDYGSVLQECANIKALKEAHARVLKSGIEQNIFLGTQLVIMYTMYGSLDDARLVFDKIYERDVFLWNVMIRGYAKHGLSEEALTLYCEMEGVGVRPDNFTATSVLKACANLSALQEGKEIHNRIVQCGLESDVFVGTALIDMYAKCGNIEMARQLFEKMSERNVVSWSALIAGYAQNGHACEALTLFYEMQLADVKPNSITVVSVLPACAHLTVLRHGKCIHAYTIRSGMESDVVVGTAMIDMYAKCRGIEIARHLFDRMSKRNVVSCNAMIAGYIQNGAAKEALILFNQMQRGGMKPNLATMVSVLPAFAILAALQQGKCIHGYIIKSGYEADVVVGTALIDMYSKRWSIEIARKMFDKMPTRNVISWNAMIAGYAQNGHANDALALFNQVQLTDMKPDSVTMVSVLPACAHLAAVQQGKLIHGNIIKSGFESDVFVGNSLIDMYAKCGSIEIARQVFDKMSKSDVISWNSMIAGYGMHGLGKDALELFSQLQQTGMKPDPITFVSVLSACSRAGLVDEGWQYFDCMIQDYCITPKVEHYACMVDLLGRAGHLEEAQNFIEQMPIEPGASVLGALLGACRIHGNIGLGECVAERLFYLEPANAGCYVLLSNIYAAAGRWDDVAKVRTMMKERGLKKPPGCSFIEVNNRVHVFSVGDRSHPQSDKIYAELETLAGQMEEAGYVPNTNFVLNDVEEELKEHMLCSHSEKLAIAFGLINTSLGTPIRITKNLRVCGDCHSATKFISKIVRREIIVRDSSRFHHFKDGLCSCGDYW